jgi:hypothetical protein
MGGRSSSTTTTTTTTTTPPYHDHRQHYYQLYFSCCATTTTTAAADVIAAKLFVTHSIILVFKIARWFKYDRDYLCVNKSQFVPVIFEPPCNSKTAY